MKRFRFTLIALCLVLVYLGWTDVRLYLENRSPRPVEISELRRGEPPQDWLTIRGGYQDLTEAISTSGSLEVKAFLVPLKGSAEEKEFHILVETRDPRILELLRTYHFAFDSSEAQEAFLQEHADEFRGVREVTGMISRGLVATGNQDKLMQLARDLGMQIPDDVIFVSEGKEPPGPRGFFFLAVGLLGLVKVFSSWRKSSAALQQPSTET